MADDFEKRYQDKHKRISMWKSGIRVGTCLAVILLSTSLPLTILAIGMLVAEGLGVAEEMI